MSLRVGATVALISPLWRLPAGGPHRRSALWRHIQTWRSRSPRACAAVCSAASASSCATTAAGGARLPRSPARRATTGYRPTRQPRRSLQQLRHSLSVSIPGAPPKLSGAVIIHLDGADNVKPAVLQVVGTQARTATFEQKTSKFTVNPHLRSLCRGSGRPGWLKRQGPTSPMRNAGSRSDRSGDADASLSLATAATSASSYTHLRGRRQDWVDLLDATDASRASGRPMPEPCGWTPTTKRPAAWTSPSGSRTSSSGRGSSFFLGAAAGRYGRRRYALWRQRGPSDRACNGRRQLPTTPPIRRAPMTSPN